MAAETVIETLTGEVAQNLEEMAEVTRKINSRGVGFLFGGLVVGAAVGFYFGHRWNREKIRAEAFAQSEAEVEMIREVYQQKAIAAEPKPSVEEIIEARGYSTKADEPTLIEQDVPRLKAPVPVQEPSPEPVSIPVDTDSTDSTDPDWIYAEELAARTENAPYVIHQEEFEGDGTGYDRVSYTYYSVDDVLVDDSDTHPIPHADEIVGQNNLKFGHGSEDPNIVYICNDRLQLLIEISRSPGSYEQEVLGLENDNPA